MSGEFGPTKVPETYAPVVRAASARWGIPPELLAAQIDAESGFNPRAVSSAGALGIAQIMPGTAAAWGVNPLDPVAAINKMAEKMAGYYKAYGSWEEALTAYHDGPNSGVGTPGPAARKYIDRIMGRVKGLINGGVGDAIDALSPLDELSDVAKILQNLRDGAFLKRVGTGALGSLLILLGVIIAFRGTVGAVIERKTSGILDGASDGGNGGIPTRDNPLSKSGDG